MKRLNPLLHPHQLLLEKLDKMLSPLLYTDRSAADWQSAQGEPKSVEPPRIASQKQHRLTQRLHRLNVR